jgi:hypothetical protein
MAEFITKIRTDEGDKQIDYNALANLPELNTMFSNPNLLINSDFRNPINQRGLTTYQEAPNWTYCIDRWKYFNQMTVQVLSGAVKFASHGTGRSWFMQEFENELPSDTYTVSVKVSSVSGTCDMKFENSSGTQLEKVINSTGVTSLTYTGRVGSVVFELNGNDSQLTIEWVKLERGSGTTPFVPRIYAEEIALCKRFYQVETLYRSEIVCCLHKRNNTSYCGIKHFEPMRVVPTVTRNGSFYIEQYNSSGQLYSTMENSISSFEMVSQWSELRFMIEFSTVDPVNYLSVSSDSVVFRLDAEIY